MEEWIGYGREQKRSPELPPVSFRFRDIHIPDVAWIEVVAGSGCFLQSSIPCIPVKGLDTGNRRFEGILKTQAGSLIEFRFGMMRKRQAELDRGGT